MGIGSWWHWIILLSILLAYMVPVFLVWRICRRAGFSGAWGLTMIVPILGLVMTWAFAFMDWPVERRAAETVK
jgi:hypothetical protein